MKKWTRLPGSFPWYLLTLPFLLWACGSDGGPTGPTGSSMVSLSFEGLQPLPEGINYQAWAVAAQGGGVVGYPLVLFNLNEEGAMYDPSDDSLITGPFQVDLAAEEVIGVGLSLELSSSILLYSSYTFILGGEMVEGTAELTTEDWLGINADFSEAAASYVLTTPTDEDGSNELSGLWFMDPTGTSTVTGLTLPDAPSGWDYEGWVVIDGTPVSTGKFFTHSAQDSGDPYSGPVGGPAFPGEDFLLNAPGELVFPADLSGSSVFITLEPWSDWDVEPATPFFLRILEGEVPAEATTLTLYDLMPADTPLPSGVATVQ